MAKTKVKCNACGKKFLKDNREINRNKRVGRNNYCNSKCAAQVTKANLNKVNPKNVYDISQHKNKRDEMSPFRFVMKKLKNSNRKECKVSLEDLKNQWDKQAGICPFTGQSMILKTIPKKGENCPHDPYQASLDRIDNDKPYEKDNVRFVSLIANYARNNWDDSEVIKFCKLVAENKE